MSSVQGEVACEGGSSLLLYGNFGVLDVVKAAEVNLGIVSAESEGLGGEGEGHEVNPASNVESVEHSVHFLSHIGERTSRSACIVSIGFISRPDLDDAVHSAGGKGSARSRVVSNTVNSLLVMTHFLLTSNPHFDSSVPVALTD